MEGLGVLLVVVAAFVASLPALREQWRTDRAGSIKTIWLFGLYCPYVGLGIVVVLLLAPTGGQAEQGALPGSSWLMPCIGHRPARSHLRRPRWLPVGIKSPPLRMFAECSCWWVQLG
jgi:hypothetical protein